MIVCIQSYHAHSSFLSHFSYHPLKFEHSFYIVCIKRIWKKICAWKELTKKIKGWHLHNRPHNIFYIETMQYLKVVNQGVGSLVKTLSLSRHKIQSTGRVWGPEGGSTVRHSCKLDHHLWLIDHTIYCRQFVLTPSNRYHQQGYYFLK